ncbi:MAG: nitroreductase [Micavibrio sp.]|nr:nitroreductase [Micavibrio sp.]
MSQPVISARHLPEMTDFLSRRRSMKVKSIGEPGPSPEQIETILQTAARVPDHGKMVPWRFIVFSGDARQRVGEHLKAAWLTEDPQAMPAKLELESERFLRAPLVIAVVFSPKESPKAPEWEQVLSAGAVCYNLCLAANSMGFATTWLTEWYAYNAAFAKAMDLGEHERFAGFVYIGTAQGVAEERERPDMAAIIRKF